MGDQSKTVDGQVDEELLGDGFSIVDSTNPTTTTTTTPAKTEEESKPKEGGDDGGDAKKQSAAPTKSPVKKEKSPTKRDKSPTKREKSPSPNDDGKVNGHDVSKGDALLIITEEDLELDSSKQPGSGDGEDESKEEKKGGKEGDEKDDAKSKLEKKKNSGDLWVSNITKHVKATDVKKHFSKHGKVLTAKIVTNGTSFFGYILMENADIANKCVKSLHGSLLDGKKISVSRQRPDAQRKPSERSRTTKPSSSSKTTTKTSSKSKSESKKDGDKDSKEKDKKKSPKGSEGADKDDGVAKKDKVIADLRLSEDRWRREAETIRREVVRIKRLLNEERTRNRAQVSRNKNLMRELVEADNKLKDERKKADRDREVYDRNSRNDRMKLEADRVLMKKELEEVRKLREYLKRKMEEEEIRSARDARGVRDVRDDHRRAPNDHRAIGARREDDRREEDRRRPRAASPYAYSSKRFREDNDKDGGVRSSKYVEERTRTPPSPPKLSSSARKRTPPNAYAVDKERDRSRHSFPAPPGVSHSSRIASGGGKPAVPAPPRNIWPSTFHQDVWRMAPGSSAPPASFSASSQYQRQSDYATGSSKNASGYSQSRDVSSRRDQRDHYTSSTVRKY